MSCSPQPKSKGRHVNAGNGAAPEEPQSKRKRITLSSHAELVDGESSSNAAAAVGDKPHPQENLKNGSRVVVRGLESRPELNGQTGQLLGFHSGHSRWLVSLDDGSKKLIMTTNLHLEQCPATTIDSEIAPPVRTCADDRNSGSSTPSADQSMRVHIESARHQALRRIEEVCAKKCAEVSQLRSDVNERCSKHPQHFLRYCQMRKPTDHDQQRARNNVREELWEVGQAVLTSMQQLCNASLEPTAALRREEANMLEEIDGAMNMLMSLRTETVATFAEYAEKLDVDRRAAEATITALAPAIENTDKFMQCLSQEVQTEKVEADRIHQELLQRLEKEVTTHVEVNDSPSWNPQFAKVQGELTALKQRHQERASRHASQMALIQSWGSMLRLLPAKQRESEEIEPRRQSFWRRLAFFTHSGAASA